MCIGNSRRDGLHERVRTLSPASVGEHAGCGAKNCSLFVGFSERRPAIALRGERVRGEVSKKAVHLKRHMSCCLPIRPAGKNSLRRVIYPIEGRCLVRCRSCH